MIGFYDYTVLLTYLSLISAVIGIITCLHGIGHPFIGMFFLMVSGLCDSFDGRVARSKKNRTRQEKSYGVQIDSLCDLAAFGVLPATIGIAMLRVSAKWTDTPHIIPLNGGNRVIYPIFLFAIAVFYVLTAMIRLAYFNVLEEERERNNDTGERFYIGLPVTSSALIFPTVLLVQYVSKADLTLLYFGVMIITAFLFISKIKINKPQLRGILIMIGIGAVEFVLLIGVYLLYRHR